MRNFLPLLLLVLVCANTFAKQSPGGEELDPFADKKAAAYYPESMLPLPITLVSVTDYLQKTLPHLAAGTGVELAFTAHKVSPGGEHFTFQQQFNGVPVFQSQTKINLGKGGKVYSIFDNSYPTATWPANSLIADVEAINGFSLAEVLASFTGPAASIKESAVIAVINNQPAAYKLLELYDAQSSAHRLYLLSKDGVVVYDHDLNSYSGVPASAYVFNPDPLTSAQVVYGDPYKDYSDSNSLVLLNERVMVNIDVTQTAAIYSLENDHFVMTDFSAPNQTVVTSLIPSFLFNRSELEFEEVNAYYHLTTFQNYIENTLGFGTLTVDQIQVDAHALNGADQSQFSFGNGFPRLFFGDGCVDDAEDADVVVHEYGHALSYAGSPGTNFGSYRQALDEGFGDYFAASYSRHISAYRWSSVFSWDGHSSECWPGRDAATVKIHPGDLTNSIHRNGEMWSTALMEVWSALGREEADKLALQTLFALTSSMDFTDAANAYLQADNALNGGANYNIIYTIMDNRGFFDAVGIEATQTAPKVPFALYNSWAFTHVGEQAVIRNFTNQPMSVTLFDISGKALQHAQHFQGTELPLDGSQLTPGTYIIKVAAGEDVQTFRLVK